MAKAEPNQPDDDSSKGAIRLSDLERTLLVADPIERRSRLLDIYLRLAVAVVLMVLFVGLNVMVATVLRVLITFDHEMLRQALSDQQAAIKAGGSSSPIALPEPIITGTVVMALIAGTVTQVGAGALVITNYLFPKRET